VVLALLALLSTSCTYARIVYFNIPNLSAPSNFDNRAVRASSDPVALAKGEAGPPFPLTDAERKKYRSFEDLLAKNDTRAFLVLHDDAIVYEHYFGKVTAETRLPAFSMSKTYAATLVGCAIQDGLIASTDELLSSYLPELASRRGYDHITIDELLRMTSGIDFQEESVAGAVLYYSTNLRNEMYSYDVKWEPGTHYLYGSVSTQLLWDVLHRILGGKTVAQYFGERLWSPLGAEEDAAWSLDSASSGIEKFFGGFSATARDHARLGLLFLHGGSFNGREVVPEAWIERSISPDGVAGILETSDGKVRHGKYQWFLTLDGRGFFAKGYHGQYVFVVPAKHAVFVRFGEGYGSVNWQALFERIADTL
jgi:CubicO group peptidase (beta-lactamase class C family)